MNAAPPTRRGGVASPSGCSRPVVALALRGVVLGLRIASPGEYDMQLGHGAMQLTGPKVWGEYPDHDRGVT